MALVLDGLLGFRLPADGSLKLYEASGNGENFIALKAPTSVSADATFVLPGTDGTAGQYLKTDGSGNLGFASLPVFPSGTVVGTTDTQTLTSKTIDLASNTLTTTLAQLNTAVSDADVASIAGTETLTNKTLTSPTISSPNFTTALTLNGSTGTAGQVLTSAGSGLPTWSTPTVYTPKTWTAFTATGTYTVPTGVTSIRAYAFGNGGNGGSYGAGGGGGGCAYGDITVTPGQSVSISISAGIATVTYNSTTMLTANPGTNGSPTVEGIGGTASKHASVTNGGAYSGGAGGGIYSSQTGGGGASGSPLGVGGKGGVRYGGGGGAGGAGGYGYATPAGGGAGGASSGYFPGVGRGPNNYYTDPILVPCISSGGQAGFGGSDTDTIAGETAGPGGGGGGVLNTGTSAQGIGGMGGLFGGGGGSFYGWGGHGGFGGGGGAAQGTGGNGGYGGGGAGGVTPGTGGAAIVLIYA